MTFLVMEPVVSTTKKVGHTSCFQTAQNVICQRSLITWEWDQETDFKSPLIFYNEDLIWRSPLTCYLVIPKHKYYGDITNTRLVLMQKSRVLPSI